MIAICLVAERSMMIYAHHTDGDIEGWWRKYHGRSEVVEVTVAVGEIDATAEIAEARAAGYAAGRADGEREWKEAEIDRGDRE